MYWHCESCYYFTQDENQSQPSCHCNPVDRPCMKHDVDDYGIKMIDYDNNGLKYIEEYSKCYMLLILDAERALSIPKRFLTCISNSVSAGNIEMPLIEREDIVLAGSNTPIVFALAHDNNSELYWRNILMDADTINRIFHT